MSDASKNTLALIPDAADGKDDAADAASLFSTRRPKNASAGMSSGLKSVAKGVGMGVVGLVAAPVIGAKENGAKGFVAGLGAGLVGAVALPVYGAAVGTVQLTRGLLNTPEAMAERARGKVWDEDTRAWVCYDLNEEARTLLALTEEEWCLQHGIKPDGGKADGNKLAGGGKVKETELYDVLGVAPDAPASTIRKAYFKLAKELHPDKNLNDPKAHAKFQAVGEAYQVLSNDDLRAKYDASGKAALDAQALVDPTSFFAMLFGSEPFEYLIGELKLATMFAHGGEADERFMEHKQKRREVMCAVTLKGLLAQFVSGDEGEFEVEMHAHAKALLAAPVGAALVWTCGYIYEHKGLQVRASACPRPPAHACPRRMSATASPAISEGGAEAAVGACPRHRQASFHTPLPLPCLLASQAVGGFDAISSNVKQTAHAAAANLRVADAAIKTYRAFRRDQAAGNATEKKQVEGKKAAAASESSGEDKGKGSDSSGAGGGGGGGAGSSSKSDSPGSLMGRRVQIQGLTGRADLNGRTGLAGAYDGEAGRYAVRLDEDDETVKVRPTNLSAVESGVGDEHAAPASSGGGDDDEEGGGEGGASGGPSENTMLLMLESMWRVSLIDIEATLRHACNKVLSDQSTDKVARKARARALIVMGRIFQSYGSPDALKSVDFAKHVAEVPPPAPPLPQVAQPRRCPKWRSPALGDSSRSPR